MGKIGGLWDSFECPNFLYLTEENINWKDHKGYEWHGIIGECQSIITGHDKKILNWTLCAAALVYALMEFLLLIRYGQWDFLKFWVQKLSFFDTSWLDVVCCVLLSITWQIWCHLLLKRHFQLMNDDDIWKSYRRIERSCVRQVSTTIKKVTWYAEEETFYTQDVLSL